jgi:hypothetical protein
MRKTSRTALVISLSLLLCGLLGQLAYAASSGDSYGTAEVTGEITFKDVKLLDAIDGSSVNASSLTVNTNYWINFTVMDDDGMDDIKNITIRVWDTGYTSTENDTDAERDHYSFFWNYTGVNADADEGAWSEPTLLGFLHAASCASSNSSSIVDHEFSCCFDLSKVANHTDSSAYLWRITIFGYDMEGNGDQENEILRFDVTAYQELTGIDSTHSWSALSSGSYDNTLSGDGGIDFTAISNSKWKVQAKANASVLIDQYGHTFNIGNITIHYDTLGSSIALTTSDADVVGLTSQSVPSSESGTATYCKLWIDVPTDQEPGAYEYKLTLTVVEDTS